MSQQDSSHAWVDQYSNVYSRATLCRSSVSSLCAALSSLLLCPVSSSCFGFPGPHLCLLNSEIPLVSAWVPLHMPQLKNFPQALSLVIGVFTSLVLHLICCHCFKYFVQFLSSFAWNDKFNPYYSILNRNGSLLTNIKCPSVLMGTKRVPSHVAGP